MGLALKCFESMVSPIAELQYGISSKKKNDETILCKLSQFLGRSQSGDKLLLIKQPKRRAVMSVNVREA